MKRKTITILLACAVVAAGVFAFARYGKDIVLYKGETMTVKVFYGNSELDPELTCTEVFPVFRVIPKTSGVGLASLEQLFKGPTEAEEKGGYFMSNRRNVEIRSLVIRNETAYVDFNESFNEGVGGSCQVRAMRAEVDATLKQFPTVKEVVISVNGETEGILEP